MASDRHCFRVLKLHSTFVAARVRFPVVGHRAPARFSLAFPVDLLVGMTHGMPRSRRYRLIARDGEALSAIARAGIKTRLSVLP